MYALIPVSLMIRTSVNLWHQSRKLPAGRARDFLQLHFSPLLLIFFVMLVGLGLEGWLVHDNFLASLTEIEEVTSVASMAA